jgi:hypothetical protein
VALCTCHQYTAAVCFTRAQLVDLFKEYFSGELNEQSIKNNFVLM